MKRIEIEINGIVQGVGFRPFIHKLVNDYEIKGYVKNTSKGVVIEVEGDERKLTSFLSDIETKCPELALLEQINIKECESLNNYTSFNIIKSTTDNLESFTLVSPDVSICKDCLSELFDKKDRRYKFPFINCTNCGPRFTIIKNIPYDRAKTVMSEFPLCSECEEEYGNIHNRRYHAQPDCCSRCGPELWFEDNSGLKLKGDAIIHAQNYLNQGKIIAIKGIGGFHLAARPEVSNELRKKKHRDQKSFAIMCRDIETAQKWCYISSRERELLESYRRPIVLLKKRTHAFDSISPDNNYLGIMLPYTPVHYLLLEGALDTIIMTSGNVSDIPIIYKNSEAKAKLAGIADGFLLNNRDIHVRCDDSVIRLINGHEYPIRRSRGYVPFPIKIDRKLDRILACGAEQKASFGLSSGNYIFMSPHIGDLKNIETLMSYEEMIEHYKKLFNIVPSQIVCDLHPDYLSTEYASTQAYKNMISCKLVQHHHAHMASCMADNQLMEEVIGVIWDGTGYGTEDGIWGGEFLVGDYKAFRRAGSIKAIKLPGGDRAVKEIFRVGYGMLYDIFGHIPEGYDVCEKSMDIVKSLEQNPSIITTTSIGRLFDGVAALLKIKEVVDYEGQAAIMLESLAEDHSKEYDYKIDFENEKYIFDWHIMLIQIIEDLNNKVALAEITSKFMNTLASMSRNIVKKISEDTGLKKVVLSGGVFQNLYLLEKVFSNLTKAGFEVFTHNRVSCNDEGIALGQIMIAQEGGHIKCV